MEAVLDNVGTAISIAQQNSVQLTRANLRLDVLVDRLARALLYMDTSLENSSSYWRRSDVSAIQHCNTFSLRVLYHKFSHTIGE